MVHPAVNAIRTRQMMNLLTVKRLVISDPLCIEARRSRVLRGVIDGFSEEARTRGFSSPSLGGFAFVKIDYFTLTVVQIGQLSIGRNRYAGWLSAYRAAVS